MDKRTRNAGIVVLAAAAAGAVAAWVIRDQIQRHSRDLFSPSFLRRLAALGHMAKAEASVDHINLMKDFVAWESREALRRRAQAIVERMERDVTGPALSAG
ncbi:MAG: hypothetical protein V3R16_11310 [Nitrospirales bacterium]